jgi:hypothetical protein
MSRPDGRAFDATARGNTITQQVQNLKREVEGLRRQLATQSRALGFSMDQPALPASTVPVANTSGKPAVVYVSGGTVTNIAVDGTLLGMTHGTFWIPPNGTIAVTYSVAPTSWGWYGT